MSSNNANISYTRQYIRQGIRILAQDIKGDGSMLGKWPASDREWDAVHRRTAELGAIQARLNHLHDISGQSAIKAGATNKHLETWPLIQSAAEHEMSWRNSILEAQERRQNPWPELMGKLRGLGYVIADPAEPEYRTPPAKVGEGAGASAAGKKGGQVLSVDDGEPLSDGLERMVLNVSAPPATGKEKKEKKHKTPGKPRRKKSAAAASGSTPPKKSKKLAAAASMESLKSDASVLSASTSSSYEVFGVSEVADALDAAPAPAPGSSFVPQALMGAAAQVNKARQTLASAATNISGGQKKKKR